MKKVSKNDGLIEDLLSSGLYLVQPDGSVHTRIARTGKVFVNPTQTRVAGYFKDGHHQMTYKRKKLIVARVVFRYFYGFLDDTKVVYHKDGNKANNHPDNLRLGTMRDVNLLTAKQRTYNPVRHYKITYAIAKAIRVDYELGMTYNQLIEKYDLAKSTISYVVTNKTWKEWNHEIQVTD